MSSTTIRLSEKQISGKAIESLLLRCQSDEKLVKDSDVQIVINTGKKMGIAKDYVPRIIPLKHCKLNLPRDLRILLITKDPSTLYRDTLTKDDSVKDLIKEIISVKNIKRRFRGAKLNQLYNEFDLVVADYRVHHLLPKVLGTRFFHGSKKLPYMIRMSKAVKVKRQQMPEECDAAYVRAQLKSICKNTCYFTNDDNCLNVKVGQVGKQSVDDIIHNIQEVIEFLTDKEQKPQGGVVKGGIESIFIKTSNSASLPIYEKSQSTTNDDSDSDDFEL